MEATVAPYRLAVDSLKAVRAGAAHAVFARLARAFDVVSLNVKAGM